MDYIIAGGAGYIGSHLVDALLEQGSVTVFDAMLTGSYVNPKSRFLKLDLREQIDQNLVKDTSHPVIIHLAGSPDVRKSFTEPELSFSTNVTTTLNIMELARKVDAKMVMMTSSAAVYGNARVIPTPETEEPNPISNYALFKILSERILKYYADVYGIPTVAARPMSVTGGRSTKGIVVDMANRLSKDPDMLEIWGDGKQKRSYIYISDLVSAFMHLAKSFKGKFDAFNIGSEDWMEVVEIARTVEHSMGLHPHHKFVEVQGGRGDIAFNFLDITKIKATGWKPKFTSKAAIEQTVKDMKLTKPK